MMRIDCVINDITCKRALGLTVVSGNQLSLLRDLLFRHHSTSSAWCRSRYCHTKKAPPASARMKTCFQGFIECVRTGWKVWLFAPSLSFGGRFCATCRLESAHEFHATPSKLQQLPARRVRAPDGGRFADGARQAGIRRAPAGVSGCIPGRRIAWRAPQFRHLRV